MLLWIFIMYKIFFNKPSKTSTKSNLIIENNSNKKKKNNNNQYTLELKNKNPFNIKQQINSKKENNKATKVIEQQETGFEYLGYIKKRTSTFANILFENKYYIVCEYDTLDRFVLISIKMDSVLVKSIHGDILTVKKRKI